MSAFWLLLLRIRGLVSARISLGCQSQNGLTFATMAQVPEWCEEEWRSLMEACWVVNPAARPSMRDICRQLELVLQMALAHGL